MMDGITKGLAGRLGLEVRLNKNLTVPGPLNIVPRDWKERLFTWPWKPMTSWKSVPTQIPDPKIYKIQVPIFKPLNIHSQRLHSTQFEEVIVAHPETWHKAEKIIERLPKSYNEWVDNSEKNI